MFTMTNFASNILDMVFLSEMEGELIYIKRLAALLVTFLRSIFSASSLSHLI
ncbi:Uncharacterised protein [Escherichia coli]|nr:Uncharacterised protein [Escherichia coli]VVZ72577.1 Uncharacterised protein [Escherichia coli]VWN04196.1 Uncharacterised protein [Escherichia coli]